MDIRKHNGNSFFLGSVLQPKVFRVEYSKGELYLFNVYNGSPFKGLGKVNDLKVEGVSYGSVIELSNKITEIVSPSSGQVGESTGVATNGSRPSQIIIENESMDFENCKSFFVPRSESK